MRLPFNPSIFEWFQTSPPPHCFFSRSALFQETTAPVESTGMGDLLESLLQLDPKIRATATEALRHRFFAEGLQ